MSTHGLGAEPRPHPIARGLTILLGIVLLVIAAIAIRDTWTISQGAHPSNGWIATALEYFGTATVTLGDVLIGVLIVLLALWLIVSALRPRPHSHLRVESRASIWMRPVDIARRSTAAVRRECGSDDISSRADRKRLTVHVAHEDPDEQFIDTVLDALLAEFDVLESALQIRVNAVPVEPREVQ